MDTTNITLLMSRDNYIYSVMTEAMDELPFDTLRKMITDSTYIFGIKTFKVFANSQDISDMIALSTGCMFKPFYKINNSPGNLITTGNEMSCNPIHLTLKRVHVEINTRQILNSYKDNQFNLFCQELLSQGVHYDITESVNDTFKSIEDADMSVQCMQMMEDNYDILLD